MADVQRYRDGAAAVLARLAAGMAIDIGLRLPLKQAAQMHQRLEAGETSGSLLLIP
jgi:NADPH2:quinone reductase